MPAHLPAGAVAGRAEAPRLIAFGTGQDIGRRAHSAADKDRLAGVAQIRRQIRMSGPEGARGALAVDEDLPTRTVDPVRLDLAGVMRDVEQQGQLGFREEPGEDLARQVYTGYFGAEPLRLQRGRDDVRVKVRYTADERRRLADLEHVRIRTPNGLEVPLMSVADVTYAPGYATIERVDGMRRVVVSAGVDTHKANAAEIFAELTANYFPELMRKYPGLKVAQQGEQKKMREAFTPLAVGYPMALLGIFIIIATIFRSYAQPLVIMFSVPFGIIGAIIGHLIMGYNLSMISMFGMVALTGVVVNDAIVLIERVNENLAEGMRFFDAIIAGGARRFRAITLTSVSTVGGLAPMILETDFQARFLIPMALSLAAGVAFATVLTLVLVPSLLAILSDFRLLSHRLRKGSWPKRVDVEPARDRHVDLMSDDPASNPTVTVRAVDN